VPLIAATGAIAGFSGLLVSADLGTGDPTIGPAYLLPASQRPSSARPSSAARASTSGARCSPRYVLAAGVKGLQLAGAPIWMPDLFNGAALLLAVGMARYQGATDRAGAIRRLLRFDRRAA
jgi:ribose transport system permease protein